MSNVFGQDTTLNAITQQLLAIDALDELYRNQIDEIEGKFGKVSEEINALYKEMKRADSINLLQVEYIIAKYGWLGYNEIGSQANAAIFMVIQHSDYKTQQKYLPMMRAAVKLGKAKGTELALLEDRVGLHTNGRQIYGSQLYWSVSNNKYFVAPIDDPDNVEKRRKEVGLPSLADYVAVWELKWDLEEYKKDLPLITAEFEALPH